MRRESHSFDRAVVLVTGGTSGIGLALGAELGRRGARVVLVGRTGANVEAAQAWLAKEGIAGRAERIDVTDAGAVREVVQRTARDFGRLDYLFNNAGGVVIGEMIDVSLEDTRRVIQVNLMGVVHGVVAALPIMIGQGNGHIVNTSSLSGLVAMPGAVAYAAAKHGVVGLTMALRQEVARSGVRVSVVCPGLVDTPIFGKTKYVGLEHAQFLDAFPERPLPVEQCVEHVLLGVARNEAMILPGSARHIAAAARWMPWLTNLMARKFGARVGRMREEILQRAGN